ncbi:MAG: 3-isopropylmalate dehydratase small subunit [Candidatus Omnitrophica bacterium]|nr:3-isopropylmalate dehydratase small subunit [Candidatus Omnitrophota bacterium]
MNYKGRVHKFGDDVNTDEIIPARYLSSTDPEELAQHCMEGIEPIFTKRIKTGDIIVAGKNFGCGSSREHAPIAIKACGVSCVIAGSFARIFYRNAINIGLPIVESKEASLRIKHGNTVRINLKKGIIRNVTKKESYRSEMYPQFIQRIMRKGGLLNSIKRFAK